MNERPTPPDVSSARPAADSAPAQVRGRRFSLTAQIAEVEYELKQRDRVYRHLVATRKLGQAEADYHTGCMEAALATLRWLQKNEAAIKAAIKAATGGPDGHAGGRGADNGSQRG